MSYDPDTLEKVIKVNTTNPEDTREQKPTVPNAYCTLINLFTCKITDFHCGFLISHSAIFFRVTTEDLWGIQKGVSGSKDKVSTPPMHTGTLLLLLMMPDVIKH